MNVLKSLNLMYQILLIFEALQITILNLVVQECLKKDYYYEQKDLHQHNDLNYHYYGTQLVQVPNDQIQLETLSVVRGDIFLNVDAAYGPTDTGDIVLL
ncbi:MAG: hypothetical protein EZS28_000860 [Streblomastix strix]|uniref:Uncharacterized protein n=1 Tax=Streblomastix strix TaxID=222440 RepID=A0A5J4XAV2_9EUKA|nr:MAG: hypothetical protein EZS28_000860 [Streblomastix strix]